MRRCPYCGHSNYDTATACRKCDASLFPEQGQLYTAKSFRVGPEKAHSFRNQALCALALGLLIKVYWGGYGPWPVMDNPALASLRAWLEPCLLGVGTVAYLAGWALRWV